MLTHAGEEPALKAAAAPFEWEDDAIEEIVEEEALLELRVEAACWPLSSEEMTTSADAEAGASEPLILKASLLFASSIVLLNLPVFVKSLG